VHKGFLNQKFYDPLFLARKLLLYSGSACVLSRGDIVLACYPKTGSTWIRYFLLHLLYGETGKDERASFDELNKVMPEFGHPSIFRAWPFAGRPRLIKTHRRYNFLFRGCPTVLLVRDPRDIMVSYYHYACARKDFGFCGSFEDMLYDTVMGLEAFFRHYKSWKGIAQRILKYECFKASPLSTFKEFSAFCGVEATDVEICQAVERSSLKNMRKAQESSSEGFKRNFEGGFAFARKGTVGQWKEHFDDRAITLYQQLKRKYCFDLYD